MAECMVCDETFNKSTRSKILCRACGSTCCKTCAREYITSTIKDAHCMNCKAPWNRAFLVENLNKSFVDGKYKKIRKKVLFEREQARFPETMEHVERMKKRITYDDMNKKINNLHTESVQLFAKLNDMKKTSELDSLDDEIDKQLSKIGKMIIERKELEFNRNILRKELKKEGILKERKVKFIHACPKEGCKGFLSTAWKCGVCDNWTCPHCFELKGKLKDNPNNPHQCKEENVKSAELIKKSTKNCPKCAVPIYKISGCDQMYCTECHIAFSWRTNEIETGTIHNPHYFQIQREMAEKMTAEVRHALENNVNRNVCGPCGDDNMPNVYLYQGVIEKMYGEKQISYTQYNWLNSLYQQVTHLNGAIMEPMRRQCRGIQNQQNLRARFILSLISKDTFELELLQNDSIYSRNIACLQIYDLFITIFRECINKITHERSIESIKQTYAHINQISSYANTELARLSYIYGNSIELFDLKPCYFTSIRFTKTEYLAMKDNPITHPYITYPLRRICKYTQASLRNNNTCIVRDKNSNKIRSHACPICRQLIETPYYASTWKNWRGKSLCLKCVFQQKEKSKQLIKSLEKEEIELIKYYTHKHTDRLSYVKSCIKGWNKKIKIKKIYKQQLLDGGASK